MNIEHYIHDLLFEHDCVILPGFGGFVVNYREAIVDFQHQQLSPPARIVAFNKSLSVNDGLLINYISRLENISYSEALQQTEIAVSGYFSEIETTKKLNLEGIGSFTKKTDSLEFFPEANGNFLRDSYGLGSFHYPLLKTVKPQQVVEEKAKEIATVVSDSRTRKPSWGIAIPVAAAIIVMIVLVFNQNNFTKSIQQNTEMNPVFIKNDSKLNATKPLLKEIKSDEIKSESTDLVKTTPDKVENQTVQNIVPTSQLKFHIVAGSFSVQGNAIAMIEKLKTQGYSATLINSQNVWYRVSVKSYSSIDEASADLQNLKTTLGNNSLWIMTAE